MKMTHDDFEAWIRDRCRCCVEQDDIDQLCSGELDFDSGEYTFCSSEVQGQWEAWQAAIEHISSQKNLVCTCHPRDGSYACPYCYSQGFRGHMER